MLFFRKRRYTIRDHSHHLLSAIALILIWRGTWHILDEIDGIFFGGNYWITAIGGIVVGLLIFYLPDGDIKELKH